MSTSDPAIAMYPSCKLFSHTAFRPGARKYASAANRNAAIMLSFIAIKHRVNRWTRCGLCGIANKFGQVNGLQSDVFAVANTETQIGGHL